MYIVGLGLVEMAISTNPGTKIYCNLYVNTMNTGPVSYICSKLITDTYEDKSLHCMLDGLL